METFLRSVIASLTLLLSVASGASEPVYLHGKFVRADLVTDDLAASRSFYSQLFGWNITAKEDHATIVSDGRELGSIVQRERPQDGKARPRWIAFMSVPDVSAIQQKVLKAGGQVLLEPQEMRELGKLGVFSDSQGAVFGAIRTQEGDPEDFIADIGSWIWIELFSHDARQSGDFYADIAGYEVWDYEPQSKALKDRTNLLLASDGYARAAVTEFPPERAQAKPSWLPFVRVSDTLQIVRKAQELGGRVVVAPSADMLDGRVAVLADTRGAMIGVMEWSEDTSEQEGGE